MSGACRERRREVGIENEEKAEQADGAGRAGLAGPQFPTPDAGVRGARRHLLF